MNLTAELAVAASHRLRSLTLLSAAGLRLPEHPVVPGAVPNIDTVLAAYRDTTALARFCWTPYLNNPKLERRLHRISAPALVVAPSDDRLIPVAHAQRYAALIRGARFAEVADSGHAMYVERPAEFAAVVASFLRSVPLARPSRSAMSGANQ